jgi:hypothetical protein
MSRMGQPYVSPGNSVGAAVIGFTNWGSISPSVPYGVLILDAVFTFSVLDAMGNALTGSIPMPLVDASRAFYFGSTDDPGFVLGDWYQVQIISANYAYQSIQQVVCQHRPIVGGGGM